jgi:GNAT superfamily N-acetyltransferase
VGKAEIMVMSTKTKAELKLGFQALTPERWNDLEKLFGERGACGGCWCMWWKMRRSEFHERKGKENKKAFKRIVAAGEVPGIIAYSDGEPVGWCALAPREKYPLLENSRTLKRVDDQPVWSVVCFFVAKPFRGQDVTKKLLEAALEYARKQGAKIVEGYPVDPKRKPMPAAFAYTGLESAFRAVGFAEVHRRSDTRPIMRYLL